MIDHSQEGIDALYPAVIECFSVIILGYLAGKTRLVSSTETKGLNTFIGTFSLPALVFISIAQLDLGSVNWPFILGIALGKTTVFVIVLLITLLVTKQCDKSGLFAIFCSQSNDFAMGYPILYALYGKEYADYLYLLGPVSLVFLNPIGFVFMEISKQNTLEDQRAVDDGSGSQRRRSSTLTVMKKVLIGVALNPVVLMTALGIAANFIFQHCVPQTLAGILKMLGSAFSASALFSLGLTMVGSAASLKGAGFVVPGILIAVKLIILPVISREFVNLLNPGVLSNETIAMTNYAFLYGTLPTAPGVFVFACQYEIYIEMIAGAMVACTFISAPLMFLAAKMIALRDLDPSDYIEDFGQFLLDVSVAGLVTAVWVVVIFVVSQKWKKVPHCITLCLVLSQVLACLGALFWCIFGVDLNNSSALYLQFSVFYFGILSTRVWTAILATSLVFLRCRSFCFLLRMRPWMTLIGWGIPALITIILLLTVGRETEWQRQNPLFQYGKSQASVSALVLVVCFVVTVGCLVMQQRCERKYTQYRALLTSPPLPTTSTQLLNDDEENLLQYDERSNRRQLAAEPSNLPSCSTINCGQCPEVKACSSGRPCKTHNTQTVSEIEDLVDSDEDDENQSLFSHTGDLCSPTKHACDANQRRHCRNLLERYRATTQLTEPEEIGIVRDRDDEFQILRHIILLLLLSISMFVGIALCLWTLVMEDLSGVYVELMFLDAALNFGQGFISFMLFGLNGKKALMPLGKWWRRLFYGEGSLRLPKWEELPVETRHVCQQFLTYHIDKCQTDIVRDRRWRMEAYTKVFCGHELVDWLILVGLVRDRVEGVKYGRHLVAGRVMRHVKDIHDFHDQPLFYTFLPSSSANPSRAEDGN